MSNKKLYTVAIEFDMAVVASSQKEAEGIARGWVDAGLKVGNGG